MGRQLGISAEPGQPSDNYKYKYRYKFNYKYKYKYKYRYKYEIQYRNSQVARLGGEWPRSADTRTVIRGRQGEGTKKPGPSIGPKCRVSNTKHKVTKLGNT